MTSVLITGGAGFVGHHIIRHILANTEWDIVTIDRIDASGSLTRISELLEENKWWRSRLKFIWHDLKSEINGLTRKTIGHVDYVIHMAAASHVDRSIMYPVDFAMDNVIGTINLLEFCREVNIEKLVYFSTDEVFGPAERGVSFREWDRYKSGNPYAASKAAAEEFVLAYHNTYGIPAVITHSMNIFGERQHPEKFIPLVMRKLLLDEEVTIHADPTCTEAGSRFYVHAEDVAGAIMFLLWHGRIGEKYNIVGNEEIDNLELALLIAEIAGRQLKFKMADYHSSRPGHDLRYALDGTTMQSMGWSIGDTFFEQLHDVVAWTMKNKRWLELTEGVNP